MSHLTLMFARDAYSADGAAGAVFLRIPFMVNTFEHFHIRCVIGVSNFH